MDKILALSCALMALTVCYAAFPDGVTATLLASVLAVVAVVTIYRTVGKESIEEANFLRRIFILALLARVSLALLTYIFKMQGFFGGDSVMYDYTGFWLMQSWIGADTSDIELLQTITQSNGFNWGMSYVVAVIYLLIGQNTLAVQLFNCVIGAATAPLIYSCAMQLFRNVRVARVSACFIAFFPSLITWSSQGLKDGLIVFLIVLAMNAVLHLQEKLSYSQFAVLLVSLYGVFTLRFYIFYAFIAAVVGSFVIGTNSTVLNVVRRVGVLVIVAGVLTYFGVIENARQKARVFDLERLQASRLDQVRSAQSGYGEDLDVSTTEGALQALPLGFTYLMLAPFPWEIENIRQAATLPEMIVWWASLPLLVYGLWYTLRTRLRRSFAVLIFTLLLTLAYSIFQGNVGTAYRQRAQLQVFYLMFVSVGAVLLKEKQENHRAHRQQEIRRSIAARA